MFRLIGLISFLSLFSSTIWSQEIYTVDQYEMNESYVDSLIGAYRNGGLEKPIYTLNKAIHIAEQLDYVNGVKNGYQEVIQFHRNNQESPLELRNLLLYANYLGGAGYMPIKARCYTRPGIFIIPTN